MRKTMFAVLAAAVFAVGFTSDAESRDRHHYRGHGAVRHYHYGYGPVWNPLWPYTPYYSPYNPYYLGVPPFVVVPQQPTIIIREAPPAPPVYIQQEPQPSQEYFWYYCPDLKTYYPYVSSCPSAWLKVTPSAPAR